MALTYEQIYEYYLDNPREYEEIIDLLVERLLADGFTLKQAKFISSEAYDRLHYNQR